MPRKDIINDKKKDLNVELLDEEGNFVCIAKVYLLHGPDIKPIKKKPVGGKEKTPNKKGKLTGEKEKDTS